MVVTYRANGSRFSSITNTRFSLFSFTSFLTWKFHKNIYFQNNSKTITVKLVEDLVQTFIKENKGKHTVGSLSYLWGPWVPWGPLLHSFQAFRVHRVGQAVLDCHLYLEVLEVLGGPLYSSHRLVASEPWGKPTCLRLDKTSQRGGFLILVWFWEISSNDTEKWVLTV